MRDNLLINSLRRIKRKMYSSIRRIKKILRINYTKLIVTDNKYKFLIPDDLIEHFSGGEYYEQNVVYFFDKIVKSYANPVMFDVGANCGYYSLRYSNLCKEIFSFEPATETHKFLEKNIKINALQNVTALKIGLSDLNEEKTINLYSNSANNTIFDRQLSENSFLKNIGTETITLRNLDELIDRGDVPVPNIIKVDIEGGELRFLKGAEKNISKYRPTMIVEYSAVTTKDAGYARELLLNVLKLTDYHIFGIPEQADDYNIIKFEDFNTREISNIIFIPAEVVHPSKIAV